MCTFLMKMREYYRWEKRLPYGARLPKEDVGNWLAEREQLWDDLADEDYAPLRIGDVPVAPFDADTANRHLSPLGLVYSAGMGRNAKPHFFLGRLVRRHSEPVAVLIADQEYARDLGAPPAMTQGDTVYIRRESLRRMLWEQLESWRWNRPDNALGRAFACYDFEGDLDGALDAMTDQEIEAALLHEIGEHQAGRILGQDWNRMLQELTGTPAEVLARSVRDHLADCLVTLPALAERGQAASLHFYLGNLTHMRKDLFPAMETAYRDWLDRASATPLLEAARRGCDHWREAARRLMGSGDPEAIYAMRDELRL
jgi:hypothetical protein